ncbi:MULTISPECIES: hypothetical protein [unclassified Sphingopyxis]|jgi:hypothetical protein|uniref:hypothetical protein n=1 Tax=unclassified Sphingopyxis TaxID=2614943 RepID=UPI000AFFEBBA|nr:MULTISPECIES: hypothetical protein [unclassified Sphingopyxis]
MMRSRNWTAIERLPDDPNAVKMTSTGYVRNGRHVRTVPRRVETRPERKSFLDRVLGR